MERPVGDRFKLNGCVYVVVKDANPAVHLYCGGCVFRDMLCAKIIDNRGECLGRWRRDGLNVHFEHFGVDF